jgi:hypothetical protein
MASVRSRTLDLELIDGADPSDSTQLAARACKLTSPANRAAQAEGLERAVRSAGERRPRARLAPTPATIEGVGDQLRDLAELLRGGAPLYAPGLAMLRELVTDGTGPLYRGPVDVLERRLEAARCALAG